ncbi:MAG TPA: hypothetical protein DD979_11215 [Gammaproteobacteria bacterium]|jgi:uncharacterized protein YaiL (DUF2058 family)|nr:hypothetical protein [Gammaproteobacteria bacterium]
MNSSLRDQLINAGFTEKKPQRKTRKKTTSKSRKHPRAQAAAPRTKETPATPTAEQTAEIAERKRIKAEIKALIEANHEKEIKGERAYSYILGNRVKQLFITDAAHEKLSKRELAITRLNGATYLIPVAIADQVRALNPEWAIVLAPDETEKPQAGDDDYAEYTIPDDLQW